MFTRRDIFTTALTTREALNRTPNPLSIMTSTLHRPVAVHTIDRDFCAIIYDKPGSGPRVYYHYSMPVAIFEEGIIYLPNLKSDQLLPKTRKLIEKYIDHKLSNTTQTIVRPSWTTFLKRLELEYGLFHVTSASSFDPYRYVKDSEDKINLIQSPIV